MANDIPEPLISLCRSAKDAGADSDSKSLKHAIDLWLQVQEHEQFATLNEKTQFLLRNEYLVMHLRLHRAEGVPGPLKIALEGFYYLIKNHPDQIVHYPRIFENLAAAHKYRYDLYKKEIDLKELMNIHQKLKNMAPDDKDVRQVIASQTGNLYRDVYLENRNPEYLHQSVSLLSEAIDLGAEGVTLLKLSANLADTFLLSWEIYSQFDLLQSAIHIFEDLRQKVAQETRDFFIYSANLAFSLAKRFQARGRTEDIDRAADLLVEVYQRFYDDRTRDLELLRIYRNSAVIFLLRYEHRTLLNDLNTAIMLLKTVAAHTSQDSLLWRSAWFELGGAYEKRSLLPSENRANDLGHAVQYKLKAWRACPPNSSERCQFAAGLAGAYQLRGRIWFQDNPERGLRDIREALAYYQKALENLAQDAVIGPSVMCNIAQTLYYREQFEGASEFSEATKAYASALDESERLGLDEPALNAAGSLAHVAFVAGRDEEAIRWFAKAAEFRERLHARQFLRRHKEGWLRKTQGLYRAYAYSLAKLGDYDLAVEVLERGVATLLRENLEQSNVQLKQLAKTNPELHRRYLEMVQAPEIDLWENPGKPQTDSLDVVLKKIRTVPGLESFPAENIRRTPSEILQEVGLVDALVYLICTERGSLALIVTKSGITPVVLQLQYQILEPLLAREKTKDTGQGFLPGQADLISMRASLDELMPVLSLELIQPLAEKLGEMKLSRLALIANGSLQLLPLHAAMIGSGASFAKDFVLSYAPSASALLAAGRRAVLPRAAGFFGFGRHDDLRGVDLELGFIRSLFANNAAIHRHKDRSGSEQIRLGLTSAHLFHFANHAAFDPQDPGESCLSLGNDEGLKLKKLFDLDEPIPTRLACLSACQSGVTDFLNLPDEHIGFPTCLLQLGAAGVVSTLWPVADQTAAIFFTLFYQHMIVERVRPAEALHLSQNELRIWSVLDIRNWLGDLKQRVRDEDHDDYRQAIEECLSFFLLTDDDDMPFAHPCHWAAFVLTGI